MAAPRPPDAAPLVLALDIGNACFAAVRRAAGRRGARVLSGSSASLAPSSEARVDLCLVAVNGVDEPDFEGVRGVLKALPHTPVVALVGRLGPRAGARLVRLGMADVIELDADPDEIAAQALEHLEPQPITGGDDLVGESEALCSVLQEVECIAPLDSTVLITGETGTGKGVVARRIHALSARRDAPFVHVDCTALSPSLVESELFGHERGSFTGAHTTHRGRFELAAAGTVFLDEIGDLDPCLQAKLLRVLQDREYERIGGRQTLSMTARVIAATNRDLGAAARDGSFRQDLYYRLNVLRIQLPPLRERVGDLPLLVRAGLQRVGQRLGMAPPEVDDAFCARLMEHAWPGNVRELMNLLERLVVCRRGSRLGPEVLEGLLGTDGEASLAAPSAPPRPDPTVRPRGCGAGDARSALMDTLIETGGNVARSARRLGIARSTLRYRIRKYGLGELIPRD